MKVGLQPNVSHATADVLWIVARNSIVKIQLLVGLAQDHSYIITVVWTSQ